MPIGGQSSPISIEGERLLWKNAQKKEKKNNISEMINITKNNFKPDINILVWLP